ncbi:MAG: hypothetical protein RSD57_19840 [Comamonas sp.]
MRRLPLLSAALAAAVLFTGCGATAPAKVAIQQVKVAVPVPCDEPEPQRPNMPTEQLPAGADVDMYVQASGAEIERREGYEVELRAALANCKRPLPKN